MQAKKISKSSFIKKITENWLEKNKKSFSQMPEISRFFGITIKMFYDDHNTPHFHAEYGSYRAIFSIDSGQIIEGNLPSKKQL